MDPRFKVPGKEIKKKTTTIANKVENSIQNFKAGAIITLDYALITL